MKCIVLCSDNKNINFNTNKNIPRTLMKINDEKRIIDYILKASSKVDEIDEIILVSNNTHFEALKKWSQNLSYLKPINVLNDTTNNVNEKLGAMGDIQYVINYFDIKDDLLIIFGDNIFDFELDEIVKKSKSKNISYIGVMKEEEKENLKDFGIIKIGDNKQVLDFTEKPNDPEDNNISLGIYVLAKEAIPYMKFYLEEGNKVDAPGYFIKYLTKYKPVLTHEFIGNFVDVNTEKDLEKAKNIF